MIAKSPAHEIAGQAARIYPRDEPGGPVALTRHAETSKPIPCPSLRAKRSNPGAAVRSSGLLAPRMLWPLDCFVARAPRNDGWVAADPIASVVIGRRLTPSFCAVSSRSYPATTNSQTVSRRAALASRCFCARARRRPRSGWESSRSSLVVTPRLRRPAGTERAYPKTVPSLPFSRKRYRHKFLHGASLRVRTGLRPVPLDETPF